MASAQRPTTTAGERMRSAWYRHPLIAFVRHRKTFTFYQQLHALIRAGIPLPTAFTQLQQYAPDDSMAKGLGAIALAVSNGSTLGDAMRKHSALLDDANVELLAFAEEAGRLEPVAAAIISHLERMQRQRWKAFMGAIWPMYLAASFVFVGPLLGAAQSMKSGGSVGGLYFAGLASSLGTFLFVIAGILGFPFLIAALGAEASWDRFIRRIPFIAAPMRTLAASRFVLGLGLATSSGMEVVRALRLSARATTSPAIIADLPLAEAALRSGSTLTDAVSKLNVLERPELGMLSVAETTGTIDQTLEKLARELEDASLRALRFLTLAITALVAAVLLVKIVGGLLGTLLGPVKSYYDAAGSGKGEGLE